MADSLTPVLRVAAQPASRQSMRVVKAAPTPVRSTLKTHNPNAEGSLAKFSSVRAMNARMVAVATKMYGPADAA